MTPIPSILTPLLNLYTSHLRTLLSDNFTGIYLHGSIALSAFNERTSDIDFVTVTERSLSGDDRRSLREVHRQLRRDEWGRRMDGIYVPRTALRTSGRRCFAYVHHGRLRSDKERLTAVARRLLHERGVAVSGPPPHELFPDVTPTELRDEMLDNLDIYWRGRLRRPWLFLSDEMAAFAVTTLPRIIHTLEHGAIIPKDEGLALLRSRFPAWSPLVDEVMSRDGSAHRLPGIGRAWRTMEFVETMIRECFTRAFSIDNRT